MLAARLALLAALGSLATGCLALPGEAPSLATTVVLEGGEVARGEHMDWGAWEAAPGSVNVTSRAFLLVTRPTLDAPPSFRVRFDQDAFVGEADPSWVVPVRGNVQFAAWSAAGEDAPCKAPVWAWRDADEDGADAFAFASGSTTACLAYRIVRVPVPLERQHYHAAFGVRPVASSGAAFPAG